MLFLLLKDLILQSDTDNIIWWCNPWKLFELTELEQKLQKRMMKWQIVLSYFCLTFVVSLTEVHFRAEFHYVVYQNIDSGPIRTHKSLIAIWSFDYKETWNEVVDKVMLCDIKSWTPARYVLIRANVRAYVLISAGN